jgi:hypothetical protein
MVADGSSGAELRAASLRLHSFPFLTRNIYEPSTATAEKPVFAALGLFQKASSIS